MAFLSMLLFYLIIILFLLYTFKNKKPIKWNEVLNALSFKSRHNDEFYRIPGPVRLPFLGTKWSSWFTDMSKLHEYYADLNNQYGDVVMEMMGNVPIVSLFKRQDIEKVLKLPSKFPFRPPSEIVSFYRSSRPDRYQSVGIVNTQHEEWAHLRMNLAPNTLEKRGILAKFSPDLNQICDDFITQIKERRNQENLVQNVDDLMKSFSFESSCCLILGKRLGFMYENSDQHYFKELAGCLNSIFKSYRDAFYGNGLWKYFPTKTYRNFVKSEEKAYDIVLKLINETTMNDVPDYEAPNVLTTILKSDLNEKDKITGIIDFLISGIETVSHTVTFILYYLSANPDVQEKIYEEVRNIKEDLTQADVSSAHYTRAAIHESFRLSPVAYALARMVEEDIYLSDYLVKKNTIVLCQNMIACTKNENFEKASQYRPERWLKDGKFNSQNCVGSSITLPFGFGKRVCPGRKYSELELMILVIKLVRSFKITYKSEFEHTFEFILAPKTPVNIQFCDR